MNFDFGYYGSATPYGISFADYGSSVSFDQGSYLPYVQGGVAFPGYGPTQFGPLQHYVAAPLQFAPSAFQAQLQNPLNAFPGYGLPTFGGQLPFYGPSMGPYMSGFADSIKKMFVGKSSSEKRQEAEVKKAQAEGAAAAQVAKEQARVEIARATATSTETIVKTTAALAAGVMGLGAVIYLARGKKGRRR